MQFIMQYLSVCFVFISAAVLVDSLGEVIYAVNCGGEAHTDLQGVHFTADNSQKDGTASEHGKTLTSIGRVSPADMILYQTERYHTTDFEYRIPINSEGHFVLVLKFCEVYFRGERQKVFDVQLILSSSVKPIIIRDLDIYSRVGFGVAHDEMIPFSIRRESSSSFITVGNEQAQFSGALKVRFLKKEKDNPKINAIVVFRGKVGDIPKLPDLPSNDEETEEHDILSQPEDTKEEKPKKARKTSGPKVENPYDLDDSSYFYPILIAIGIFIPSVLCLCKL